MGDFSDKSSEAKQLRIPIKVLFRYIKEAREIELRRPPRRFITPPAAENELTFEEKGSLSTTRVRQRLCDLMGTDVIRLNDKRYFQKLSQRLHEEQESIMDKQEELRSASEEQRLRRLMLEGVIDAPNDYRAVIHGDHKKGKKKKKRRNKRKTAVDGSSQASTERHATILTPHQSDDEGDKKEVVTQVEILSRPNSSQSGSRVQTGHANRATSAKGRQSALSKKESKDEENERRSQPTNDMNARPPHHESAVRSSSSSSQMKSRRVKSASARFMSIEKAQSSDESDDSQAKPYDTQSLPGYTRRQTKFSKQEPERIREMRNTETVAGLYSIAEELVSPVKTAELTDTKRVKIIAPSKND